MERITGLPALLAHRRLKLALVISSVLVIMAAIVPLSSRGAGAEEHSQLGSCSAVAGAIAGTDHAGQLITVIASTIGSETAALDFYVRQGGCFRLVDGPYPAFVGRNGLSLHHHEGDDTTPMGLFGFQSTMYGVLPNPGVAYPYHHLVCGDWWDEQSSSPLYNHFVHVPCGSTPNFGGDSEALWETVPLYDYFAVIAYNRHPIIPGRGSAIFLHVSDGHATTGCVSIPAADLLRVLRALRPSLNPLIDITTRQLMAS
jgi:L,D-peptidoglycan transpeptidase YkuD (ErfK/YbiS/YcfS/YnhG family)